MNENFDELLGIVLSLWIKEIIFKVFKDSELELKNIKKFRKFHKIFKGFEPNHNFFIN